MLLLLLHGPAARGQHTSCQTAKAKSLRPECLSDYLVATMDAHRRVIGRSGQSICLRIFPGDMVSKIAHARGILGALIIPSRGAEAGSCQLLWPWARSMSLEGCHKTLVGLESPY